MTEKEEKNSQCDRWEKKKKEKKTIKFVASFKNNVLSMVASRWHSPFGLQGKEKEEKEEKEWESRVERERKIFW